MNTETLELWQELNDPDLIGSYEVGDSSNKSFSVINPATNEVVSYVPDMDVYEAENIVDLATKTFQDWKKKPVDERAAYLHSWANLIRDNVEDLSKIMTIEQGKPLTESRGEINYSASYLDWYAEEAQRDCGRLMPAHNSTQRLMISYQPLGVGAIITPWNFPALMILREAAPAIASGCTVVVKPADLTPLTAIALSKLAERANLPKGVFSIITTSIQNTPAIGQLFTSSLKIHKISFTGSTETGKRLAEAGAQTLTRMSLELGGNAPFIVFDDADLDSALAGLIASKFRNAGQACVASNRIFIQDGIYDQFVKRFVEKTQEMVVGNGIEKGVSVGPLISMEAVEKIEGYISDALTKGGNLLLGGKRHSLGGNFFEPTIIADATPEMLTCQCEIFGPLAMLYRFKTEAEVLEKANDSIHGLAAYFYSRDRARCWRVAEGLEAGVIGENTVAFSSARTPFGGFKQSGIGRDGGVEGLREWQEIKYRCIGEIE
jgi:succinate-semialdehyde dehydrogenase/glutarate-semialdehyde dehydrogenase